MTFVSSPWLRRARLTAAVALIWAGLYFVVGPALLPAGLHRPLTLAASPSPVWAGLAVAAWLCVGAYVGPLVAGARYRQQGLLIVAVALALWGCAGGTMDDWLVLSAKDGMVAPPTGGPYWPLVLEYVFLALVMALVAAVAGLPGASPDAPKAPSTAARLRRALGLDIDRRERLQGWFALLSTTLILGILTLVLIGPAAGWTLTGQVYFAVAVGCAVAVFGATRVVRVRQPIWYWPAPILAGFIGVLLAALKPSLTIPAEYHQLNSIPAWGLARPLPMQMVGMGVAVCLWTLRALSGGSRPERA